MERQRKWLLVAFVHHRRMQCIGVFESLLTLLWGRSGNLNIFQIFKSSNITLRHFSIQTWAPSPSKDFVELMGPYEAVQERKSFCAIFVWTDGPNMLFWPILGHIESLECAHLNKSWGFDSPLLAAYAHVILSCPHKFCLNPLLACCVAALQTEHIFQNWTAFTQVTFSPTG